MEIDISALHVLLSLLCCFFLSVREKYGFSRTTYSVDNSFKYVIHQQNQTTALPGHEVKPRAIRRFLKSDMSVSIAGHPCVMLLELSY
jgi:hypothetical protein